MALTDHFVIARLNDAGQNCFQVCDPYGGSVAQFFDRATADRLCDDLNRGRPQVIDRAFAELKTALAFAAGYAAGMAAQYEFGGDPRC